MFIAHGRHDPVMNVEFARTARETLAGMDVTYLESDAAHHIDPAHVRPAPQPRDPAPAANRAASAPDRTRPTRDR